MLTIFSNQKNPKDQRNIIYKEVFLTVPIVIYTRKNFYLLEVFNEKIEDLKAGGLIDFWDSEDKSVEPRNEKDEKYPNVLMTSQLMGCFHLLLIGCLTSFVVFDFENFNTY